jgi:hypothetical protein
MTISTKISTSTLILEEKGREGFISLPHNNPVAAEGSTSNSLFETPH